MRLATSGMEISWAESIGFTVGLFLGIGLGVVVRGVAVGAQVEGLFPAL